MKISGVFDEKKVHKKASKKFFMRLVPARTYSGAVSVEAVDEDGERICLICRISKEAGLEVYGNIVNELGLPMDASKADSIKVQSKPTH